MFRQTINTNDFSGIEKNVGEEHKIIASTLRKKNTYQTIESLTVNDLSFFPNFNEHPIMFDDIYVNKNPKLLNQKKLPKSTLHQKYIISNKSFKNINKAFNCFGTWIPGKPIRYEIAPSDH